MRRILTSLSILMFGFLFATPVRAQQPALANLKADINRLQGIVVDANTPPDLKAFTLKQLAIERSQLVATLETQVRALQRYQAVYGSRFSARESTAVKEKIQNAEREIQALRRTGGSLATSSLSINMQTAGATTSPRLSLASSAVTSPTYAAVAAPQTQVVVIRSKPDELTSEQVLDTLDVPNAAIFNSRDAETILKEAVALHMLRDAADQEPVLTNDQFADSFYAVIHVVRWADLSATASKEQGSASQTVAAQNWYLYNNGKGKGFGNNQKWSNENFTSLNRIFGVKKVWILYIHLNRVIDYDQARYDFNIEKKTPTNVSNLFGVASLFLTFPADKMREVLGDVAPNVWGGGAVDLDYVPSYVTITASFVKDRIKGPVTAIDKPKKFENEGRYWWDVSVGVPVRHISETKFDLTANTVTAKEVNKQNVFALLNLYPVPIDLNGSNYSWIPHFVGGVAIAKQPLKKFLLGAGFGPNFANFYVGAVFTEEKKPATLKEGDTATPTQLNADLQKHFKPKFSFGFNLPVRGILESLKKESK